AKDAAGPASQFSGSLMSGDAGCFDCVLFGPDAGTAADDVAAVFRLACDRAIHLWYVWAQAQCAASRIIMRILLLAALAVSAFAQSPDWTEPFAPFKIADNLYYV